jgi:hypothetical protein
VQINGEIGRAQTAVDVLHIFRDNVGRDGQSVFNVINFSTAICKLGKLAGSQATKYESATLIFQGLETSLNQSEWHARNIANVAGGMAKMKSAFEKRGEPVDQLGGAINRILAALGMRAIDTIHSFNSQDIANTVWAFATAGIAAPKLFDTAADAAVRKIGNFNEQNIANTVWAFATAGIAAPALFTAAADAAVLKIGRFTEQEIANTVWAFATPGIAAPKLFDAATDATIHNAKPMIASELWIAAPSLLELFEQRFEQQFERLMQPSATSTTSTRRT